MAFNTDSSPKYADIKDVRITDAFFAPWIEKIRNVTVPDVFMKFLEDGTTQDGKPLTLMEYRRWNNSGPVSMRVWMRQCSHVSDPFNLEGWEGRLYREWSANPT